MNPDDFLEKLSARARKDVPPPVDVTQAVLARIQSERRPQVDAVAVLAGSSAAAAVIVLAYALQAWSSMRDPISSMLASMNPVLQ